MAHRLGIIIGLAIGLFFYFLPTLVATWRGHHNRLAIFVMNLFLGCTGLGWVFALVWACTSPSRSLEDSN
jgi:hypothetical protein